MRSALVFVLTFLIISHAEAQDAEPLRHPRTGADGLWLPLSMGQACVRCLDDRDSLRRETRLLDQQLAVRASRIELLDASVTAMRAAVEGCSVDLEEERAHSDAWYRSPWLWLSVGVGFGATLVALAFSLI